MACIIERKVHIAYWSYMCLFSILQSKRGRATFFGKPWPNPKLTLHAVQGYLVQFFCYKEGHTGHFSDWRNTRKVSFYFNASFLSSCLLVRFGWLIFIKNGCFRQKKRISCALQTAILQNIIIHTIQRSIIYSMHGQARKAQRYNITTNKTKI